MQVSIVNFSQIDKRVFRLEAEFHASNILTSNEYFTGEQILELGEYNSIYGLNDEGKGYPVIRMNEFNSLFIGNPSMHSINFGSMKNTVDN